LVKLRPWSNLMLVFYLVITLVDARHAWKLSKSPLLSCLRQLSYVLLCYVLIFKSPPCWFQTLWLPLFDIPPLYSACSSNPNMCHLKVHLGCRLGNGVLINNWWRRDKTKSLLWWPTQGCAARHVLVSRFLVMIHYRTTLMCYFHVNFSLVIPHILSRRSISRTNCSRDSSWSC
jgi:hypothetical protein